MSIKPVRLYIEPILHKPCQLVDNFNTPELEQLAGDMIQTMMEYRGVGLAANQIAVDKNICILSLENKSKQIIVTNPSIIRYTKEVDTRLEGCLSAPGVTVNMTRPLAVELEYYKLNGEKTTLLLEGYDARIFFHEYDHLQGKMIIDVISKF